MDADFASWLKAEREKLNLSAKSMAAMLDISERKYWQWETGERKPGLLEDMGARALLAERSEETVGAQ